MPRKRHNYGWVGIPPKEQANHPNPHEVTPTFHLSNAPNRPFLYRGREPGAAMDGWRDVLGQSTQGQAQWNLAHLLIFSREGLHAQPNQLLD